MKIAICFFGITRSLAHTLPSIEENVLTPAREIGEVKTFAHFFRQKRVENIRSRESVDLDPEEYRLLKADVVDLEEPDACLELYPWEELKAFGDTRRDDFQSLRNLVHALHSLKQVTNAALAWKPDLVIFVRPDLQYHDSLRPHILQAAQTLSGSIFIPNWQHWRGGYNDRFAICVGPEAASVFGKRADVMLEYCRNFEEPLHSESLVKFAVKRAEIDVHMMGARASRVRANGRLKNETFKPSKLDAIKTMFRQFRRLLRAKPRL